MTELDAPILEAQRTGTGVVSLVGGLLLAAFLGGYFARTLQVADELDQLWRMAEEVVLRCEAKP